MALSKPGGTLSPGDAGFGGLLLVLVWTAWLGGDGL